MPVVAIRKRRFGGKRSRRGNAASRERPAASRLSGRTDAERCCHVYAFDGISATLDTSFSRKRFRGSSNSDVLFLSQFLILLEMSSKVIAEVKACICNRVVFTRFLNAGILIYDVYIKKTCFPSTFCVLLAKTPAPCGYYQKRFIDPSIITNSGTERRNHHRFRHWKRLLTANSRLRSEFKRNGVLGTTISLSKFS